MEVRKISHDSKIPSFLRVSKKFQNLENKSQFYYCCKLERPREKSSVELLDRTQKKQWWISSNKKLRKRTPFLQSMKSQLKQVNKSMVHMQATHNERIRYKKLGESVTISILNCNTNEYILDLTESKFATQSKRHMTSKSSDSHLSYGGCGICAN